MLHVPHTDGQEGVYAHVSNENEGNPAIVIIQEWYEIQAI
jgi:hypothetical protein